jgi:hypothetical protein
MADFEFDPVKYGVLWQKVQDMDKKIDKMEGQLDQLIGLANQGKGGLWIGMAIASTVAGVIGFLLSYWRGGH